MGLLVLDAPNLEAGDLMRRPNQAAIADGIASTIGSRYSESDRSGQRSGLRVMRIANREMPVRQLKSERRLGDI